MMDCGLSLFLHALQSHREYNNSTCFVSDHFFFSYQYIVLAVDKALKILLAISTLSKNAEGVALHSLHPCTTFGILLRIVVLNPGRTGENNRDITQIHPLANRGCVVLSRRV